MRLEASLERIVFAQPAMMEVLRWVASLELSDWMIGAGFVRNAVWDALHERAHDPLAADIDVMHFGDGCSKKDAELEETLGALGPIEGSVPRWDVKDQSRMHQRYGYAPYASSRDALAAFPETCTSVALRLSDQRLSDQRLSDQRLELIAPHGLEDLFSLRIRRSPSFRGSDELYKKRVQTKKWLDRWPLLSIADY